MAQQKSEVENDIEEVIETDEEGPPQRFASTPARPSKAERTSPTTDVLIPRSAGAAMAVTGAEAPMKATVKAAAVAPALSEAGESSDPQGFMDFIAQYYGQVVIDMKLMKEAVDEIHNQSAERHSQSATAQSATAHLVQTLVEENHVLRSRLDGLELKISASGGGSRPATLAELRERRVALAEIKADGFGCGEVKAAGYSCADAKAVGYTLLEAKAARWSPDELRAAGYTTDRSMTAREFFDRYQAGCTNFAGMDFSGEDFSCMVLDKACNFCGCNFTDAKFNHATLIGLDFSGATMVRVDLSHASVKECTFTSSQMQEGNLRRANLSGSIFQKTDLSDTEFGHARVQSCDFTGASFVQAAAKAKWAHVQVCGGLLPSDLLRQIGFSCAEAKAAGLSCKEAKDGGYSLREIKVGGYVQGLAEAGYSCAEAKEEGYGCHEAEQAGWSAKEGEQAGFPCCTGNFWHFYGNWGRCLTTQIISNIGRLKELKAGGMTCEAAKAQGYSCFEAKEAGYGCHEAEQAGWSAEEGLKAGYGCCDYSYRKRWHYWNGTTEMCDGSKPNRCIR